MAARKAAQTDIGTGPTPDEVAARHEAFASAAVAAGWERVPGHTQCAIVLQRGTSVIYLDTANAREAGYDLAACGWFAVGQRFDAAAIGMASRSAAPPLAWTQEMWDTEAEATLENKRTAPRRS